MVKKWICSLVAITYICSLISSINVQAVSPLVSSSRIEGVLVVDVSRSMLTSDPNKISNEAMKMFVDMSSLQGDKIGIIAYAGEVMAKQELVKLQTDQDKKGIKDFIDSLGNYPNTDMSVGVKEAIHFLDNGHEQDYLPFIVLLADGNNDVNEKSGRTNQQADEELQASVTAAKEKGYPIYVIGLNANGQLNKALLENIAITTSGKFFETSNANDLPKILSEIFATHLKLKVVPVNDLTGNGEFQDITFSIPNNNVLEANISFVSGSPVEIKLVDPSGNEQALPSENLVLTASKSYSMLKMINPGQGDWTLKVKGLPEEKIDIDIVFNYDLQLKLSQIADKNLKAGNKVKVSAHFEDDESQIANKELYHSMKATLFVKNLGTGAIEEILLTSGEDGFTGEFTIGDSGTYEIMAKAEGESFYRETAPQQITIPETAEAAPVVSKVDSLTEAKPFPWLYVGIAAAIVLILTILTIFYFTVKKRKEKEGFTGQIILEIKDEVTGERSQQPAQALKSFKGEFNLKQLFMLGSEYTELEKITFVPLTNDALLLFNKSNSTIQMDGAVIEPGMFHRFRRNDKLRIRLTDINKTIHVINMSIDKQTTVA